MSALHSFLWRIFVPVVLLVLALSLGTNAFLLLTEPGSDGARMMDVQTTAGTRILQPIAFGRVDHGFKRVKQVISVSGSFVPVGSYAMPSGILPTLPAELPLYRDQGIGMDTAFFGALFSELGVPVNLQKVQLLPERSIFRTSDGMYEYAIDLKNRSFDVRVRRAPAAALGAQRAGDDEIISLAASFASTLGISTDRLGVAHAEERLDPVTNAKKTTVVWPLRFSGSDVIDPSGHPVDALAVDIGRFSRAATALRFNLFSPEKLTQSAYPTAGALDLVSAFASGGVLPLSNGGALGKSVTATFDKADLAYVLHVGDDMSPTYFVPVVRASWLSALSCAGCAPVRVWTFVPALASQQFSWFVSVPVPPPPPAALVPSSAPRTASGAASASAKTK